MPPPGLGAEVYGVDGHELIVDHTCKSRACSSCGYRATVQWLRERWAALPEVIYKGVTFTMPKELWSVFRDNPLLARALPVLAAKVIQSRMSAKYGLRVGVIAILHTFNGKLGSTRISGLLARQWARKAQALHVTGPRDSRQAGGYCSCLPVRNRFPR